uniref:Uncharacterized protein n=1 Tax=Plectus sambesii TaxID=2011161 RepID=A0A914WPT4_9BILA
MDFLPDVLRREWMTAIAREGSGAIEKAALNVCRAIGEELRTIQKDTAERKARLEVFIKCIQTVLFAYGERTFVAGDGDETMTRDRSWDFYAAVLSVYLDILALLAKSFDKAALDISADHFASQVNFYLKDSVLHMMDVFLQSEQASVLAEQHDLIAPSVKLIANNLPLEPSLWEYARAIVLVHSLKLTSTKSPELHRTLKRVKTPEDAQHFFASTIGALEQTNNNEGDLTQQILSADISADDCERIIEALTNATEASEYSSARLSALDSADESLIDDDDLIIDRGPVEAMDEDVVHVNPVVSVEDDDVALEADVTVSSGSGRGSQLRHSTTPRQPKRKFNSMSSGEQEAESNSRRKSAQATLSSSPIGCVDVMESDRTPRLPHSTEETKSPTRRSRRISHLSGSDTGESEKATNSIERRGPAKAFGNSAKRNEYADGASESSGAGHEDEEEDDEEGEGEKRSGGRVRTAPSSIYRQANARPADKANRMRVSAPNAKTTGTGEPTPPLKMRLRSKTNAPVDLSRTPVASSTTLKKAKTAKATKAATSVAPTKTESRVNKRTAKTPKH